MSRTDQASAATAAMLTAAAMIAFQVAGRATRDALFLSNFPAASQPKMLAAASIASLVIVLLTSRAMTNLGPSRLLPAAFAASGAVLLVCWALSFRSEKAAAVVFYLHVATFGSVLVSSFWTLVNERFDPRAAKRQIGRIAGWGTLGGLAGGVVADRVGTLVSIPVMLPTLAVFHLVCAWAVLRLRLDASKHGVGGARAGVAKDVPADSRPARSTSLKSLIAGIEAPYLRDLAVLVLTTAVAAALVDYVFVAEAKSAFPRRHELMHFFSLFYTGMGLLTFLLQSTLSHPALNRGGLAVTVATLPSATALSGLLALAVPGLATTGVIKGSGEALKNSLFRSAYELLYSPIPRKEKRATKTIVDVGLDRLGTALGCGLTTLLLVSGPAAAKPVLVGLIVVMGLAGVWMSVRLHRGYVGALERNLVGGVVEVDPEALVDTTTRDTVRHALRTLEIEETKESREAISFVDPGPPAPASAPRETPDFMDRLPDLRSGDPDRIRRALDIDHPLPASLVPHVIPLLARDDVAAEAAGALRRIAGGIAGQLQDAIANPDLEFAARRMLPGILAAAPPERAMEGLLLGLQDRRFEVRYACGRVLSAIREEKPGVHFDRRRVFTCVLREIDTEKKAWETQKVFERMEQLGYPTHVDERLRDRARRSLDHVFTVLSLALPRTALHIALEGLRGGDEMMRGISLEYFESVLPPEIRESLWPYLEDHYAPGDRVRRPREEILMELLQSQKSMELNIEALKKIYEEG